MLFPLQTLMQSRAMHGMYIIGDSRCAKSCKMWNDVIQILRDRGQIGTSLKLRCPRHEMAEMHVREPLDFELLSPEGGCKEPCGLYLDCGHACKLLCHAESRHHIIPCRELCSRAHQSCGHACQKRCSDPCGKCTVPIKNVELSCGHAVKSIECWAANDLSKAGVECKTRITRTLSRCGHEAVMSCSESPEEFKCKKECGGILVCGHTCSSRCHECRLESSGQRQHKACTRPCGRPYKSCSHRCRLPCHSDKPCAPCNENCELRCEHARCRRKCGEFCIPCAEKCAWTCRHGPQCGMPCGAPCDRLPCNARCDIILECGHQCPSICGEICPGRRYCQICGDPEVLSQVVDYVEFEPYSSVNLDENPILLFPCGHIFSKAFTDGLFEIDTFYKRDEQGSFLEAFSSGMMNTTPKPCPTCRMHVSGVRRYNRILKRGVLDLMLKNMLVRSRAKFDAAQDAFEVFENELEKSRHSHLKEIRAIRLAKHRRPGTATNIQVINNRMASFGNLRRKIQEFRAEVDEGNQPHMKVYNMSVAAWSRTQQDNDSKTVSQCPLDVPKPDIQFRLWADIFTLRLETTFLEDHMEFLSKFRSAGCQIEAKEHYNNAISKCHSNLNAAEKGLSSCEGGSHYRLAIEFLLLQLHFVSLEMRAANAISARTKTKNLREHGTHIIERCDRFISQYPSCQSYKSAVDTAKTRFPNGSFQQAVTLEERKAIARAMYAEFSGTGHWYQCNNGHPVHLHLLERLAD